MIDNKFIAGILKEFNEDFKFSGLDESKLFEYLINYIIVKKIHPEAFDDSSNIEELDVDDGSNFGIDGVAIIVNNNLILSKDEIEVYRKSRNLDVRLIFTQSKIAPNYDGGSLYKFIGAVKNFFAKTPDIPITEDLEYFRDIYNTLFDHENARYLNKYSPSCQLYYATTGKEATDSTILGIAKQGESTIKDFVPELKSVKINLVGADYIIDNYNEIENRFEVTINFKNNLSLDRIDSVDQSYIGYLTVPEFFKLIEDKENNLRRNLFYENVRDFQGENNTVNFEISETISSKELQDKFILLNNGITVVAKYFKYLGSNDYEIRDYQVVNGCQTSTIIFKNKCHILSSPSFLIPIKIIHTNNSDLISRIIKATNRQTPVPEEAFIALDKFHKRLQEFYIHYSSELPESLFYERRSKEYLNSEKKIDKSRIVNLHSQIRAYTAVFLTEPHLVYNNNPSEILKSRADKFFQENHSYYPYFVSNYLLFMLQKLFDSGKISTGYALFRYYAIMIFRILSTRSFKYPPLASKDITSYCQKIINQINDENKRIDIFNRSFDIIKRTINENRISQRTPVRNIIRTVQFKDSIFENLKKIRF